MTEFAATVLDARLVVEGLVQEHKSEQGVRIAYCLCGAPTGLWGTEWPKHISDVIVGALEHRPDN